MADNTFLESLYRGMSTTSGLDAQDPIKDPSKPETPDPEVTGNPFEAILFSSTQTVGNMGFADIKLPSSLGTSQYDRQITRAHQLDNIDDMRGQLQPLSDKLGNTAAKFIGGTLINGIGGLAAGGAGLYEFAKTKDKSKIWNASIAHSFDNMSEEMQEMFPHYYMEADRQKSLWDQAFTYNFWGDEFVNGLSFMSGAMLTGVLTGYVGTAASLVGGTALRGASMAARAANVNKMFNVAREAGYARAMTMEGAKTIGAASTLASTGRVLGETVRQLAYITTGAVYESGLEARHAYDTVKEGLLQELAGDRITQQEKGLGRPLTEDEKVSLLSPREREMIEERATSAGNYNFLANMGLVGMGNLISLSRLYGADRLMRKAGIKGSYAESKLGEFLTTGKKAISLENAARTIGAGKWLLRAGYEGFIEEGGQGIVSRYAENYVTNAVYTDPDGKTYIKDYLEDLGQNFASASSGYFDRDNLKEVVIGSLIGGIGAPSKWGGPGMAWAGSVAETRKVLTADADLKTWMEKTDSVIRKKIEEDKERNPEKYLNQKHNAVLYHLLTNRAKAREAAEKAGDDAMLRKLDSDDLFDKFFAMAETGQLDNAGKKFETELKALRKTDPNNFKELFNLPRDASEEVIDSKITEILSDLNAEVGKFQEARDLVDRTFPQLREERYTGIDDTRSEAWRRRVLIYSAARAESTDAREKALIEELAKITNGTVESQKGFVDEIVYKDAKGDFKRARIGTMNTEQTVERQLLESTARIASLEMKSQRSVKEEEDLANLKNFVERLRTVKDKTQPINGILLESNNDLESKTLGEWTSGDPIKDVADKEVAKNILSELRDLRAQRIAFNTMFLQAADPTTYAKVMKETVAAVTETVTELVKEKTATTAKKKSAIQEFKKKLERFKEVGYEDLKTELDRLNAELENSSTTLAQALDEVSGLEELNRQADEKLKSRPTQRTMRVEGKQVSIESLRKDLETAKLKLTDLQEKHTELKGRTGITNKELQSMLDAIDLLVKDEVTEDGLEEFIKAVESSENIFREESNELNFAAVPGTEASVDLLRRYKQAKDLIVSSISGTIESLTASSDEAQARLTALEGQIAAAETLLERMDTLTEEERLQFQEEFGGDVKAFLETQNAVKLELIDQIEGYKKQLKTVEDLKAEGIQRIVDDYMAIRKVQAFQKLMSMIGTDVFQNMEKDPLDADVESFEDPEYLKTEEEDKHRFRPKFEAVGFLKTAMMGHENAIDALKRHVNSLGVKIDTGDIKALEELAKTDARVNDLLDILTWYDWVQGPDTNKVKGTPGSFDSYTRLLAFNENSVPVELMKVFPKEKFHRKDGKESQQIYTVAVRVKYRKGGEIESIAPIMRNGRYVYASLSDPVEGKDVNEVADGMKKMFSGIEDYSADQLSAKNDSYRNLKTSLLRSTVPIILDIQAKSSGVIRTDQESKPADALHTSNDLNAVPLVVAVPQDSQKGNKYTKINLPGTVRTIEKISKVGLVYAFDSKAGRYVPMKRNTLRAEDQKQVALLFHSILERFNSLKEEGMNAATARKAINEFALTGKFGNSTVNIPVLRYIKDIVQLRLDEEGSQYQLQIGLKDDALHVIYGPESKMVSVEDMREKGEVYNDFMAFLATKRYHVKHDTLNDPKNRPVVPITQGEESGKPGNENKYYTGRFKANTPWYRITLTDDLKVGKTEKFGSYNGFLLTANKEGKAPLTAMGVPVKGVTLTNPFNYGGYIVFRPQDFKSKSIKTVSRDIPVKTVENQAAEPVVPSTQQSPDISPEGDSIMDMDDVFRGKTPVEVAQNIEDEGVDEMSAENEFTPEDEQDFKGNMSDVFSAANEEGPAPGDENVMHISEKRKKSVDAQIKNLEKELEEALKKNDALKIQDLRTKVAEQWKGIKETSEDLREYIATDFAEKHNLSAGEVEILIEFVNMGEEDINSNPFIYYVEYPEEIQKKYNLREKTKEDVENQWARFNYKFPDVDKEKISELAQLEDISGYISHELKGAFLSEIEGESGLPNNMAELNKKRIIEEFAQKRAILEQQRVSTAIFTSNALLDIDYNKGVLTVKEGDTTVTLTFDPTVVISRMDQFSGNGKELLSGIQDQIIGRFTAFMRTVQGNNPVLDLINESVDEEVARVNGMTPLEITVTEALIGRLDDPAVAQLTSYGKVLIDSLAPSGALYHEAFHNVSLYILSKRDRNALYNMVRRIPGTTVDYLGNTVSLSEMNDMQAEEWLAEEFRAWILSGMTRKIGQEGIVDDRSMIQRFFDTLKNILRRVLNLNNGFEYDPKMRTITDMFSSVEKGTFLKMQPAPERSSGSDMYMRKRHEGLTQEQALKARRMWLGTIMSNLDSEYNTVDGPVTFSLVDLNNYLTGTVTPKDDILRRGVLFRSLGSLQNTLRDNKERYPEGSKERVITDSFISIFGESIGTHNRSVISSLLAEYMVELGMVEKSSVKVDSDEDRADSKEEGDDVSNDENWDRKLGEQDVFTVSSKEYRLLIGTLVKPEPDALGLPDIYPIRDIARQLRPFLINSLTHEETVQRIKDITEDPDMLEKYPWAEQLYTRLSRIEEDVRNNDMNALRFRQAISADMRKTMNTPALPLVSGDGRVTVTDPAEMATMEDIKTEWNTNLELLLSRPGTNHLELKDNIIVFKKDGTVTLPGMNPINFDKLQQRADNAGMPELLSIANVLGIRFSDPKNMVANGDSLLENGKTVKATLYEALSSVISDNMKQGLTAALFSREYSGQVTRMNSIVQMEMMFGRRPKNNNFVTATGKRRYSEQDPTFISSLAARNWDQRWDLKETSYAENSILANRLKNNDGKPLDLKVREMLGLRSSESREDGDAMSKLQEGDLMVAHVNAVLQGITVLPRSSDSNTELGTELGIWNSNLLKDPTDTFLGYLEDEMMQAVRFSYTANHLKFKQFSEDGKRQFELRLMGTMLPENLRDRVNAFIRTKLYNSPSKINAPKAWEKLQDNLRREFKTYIQENRNELSMAINATLDNDAARLEEEMLRTRILEQPTVLTKEYTGFPENKYALKGLHVNLFSQKDVSTESYSEGQEYITVNESLVKKKLREAVLRHAIGKHEMFKFFIGDPAMFFDLFKRLRGAVGPKILMDTSPLLLEKALETSDMHHRTVKDGTVFGRFATFEELKGSMDPELLLKFKKFMTKEVMSQYVNMKDPKNPHANVTDKADGTIWASSHFLRYVAMATKPWDSVTEEAYQGMRNGVIPTPEMVQKGVGFAPQKLQYFGPARVGGMMVPNMFKMSVVSLDETLGKVGNKRMMNYLSMVRFLEDNGLDGIVLPTAHKVGTPDSSALSTWEMIDGVRNPVLENRGTSIVEIDLSYLGVQQQISQEYKGKVLNTVQAQSHLPSDMYENGKPVKETEDYIPLVEEFNNLRSELVKRGFDEMMKEFNITFDPAQERYIMSMESFEKLKDFLMEEGSKRDVSEMLLTGLESIQPDFFKMEMLIDPFRMETILFSALSKRTIKQKRKGEMLIQMSEAGYEVAEVTNPDGTTSLESSNLGFYENPDGKWVMEIYAPNFMKDLLGQELTVTEEGIMSEGRIVADREALDAIGIRIPTDGIHSIEIIRIKDFLPPHAGPAVVVPHLLLKKAGSDFDIDKLTMYFKNLRKKADGTLEPLKYYNTLKDWFNDEADRKLEAHEFLMNRLQSEMMDAPSKKDLEEMDKFVKTLFNTTDFEEPITTREQLRRKMEKAENRLADFWITSMDGTRRKVPFESWAAVNPEVTLKNVLSKEALENRTMDIMKELLSLKSRSNDFMRPVSTSVLDSIAGEFMELKDVLGLTDITDLSDLHYMTSLIGNIKVSRAAWEGKQTVGAYALTATHHVKAQRAGLGIELGKNIEYAKDMSGPLRMNFEGFTELEISLARIFDVKGQYRISDIISQLVNAAVDNANNPLLQTLNFGLDTAGAVSFLVRAGVPIRTVALFMRQPIVTDYIEEVRIQRSMFLDTFDEQLNYSKILEKVRENYRTEGVAPEGVYTESELYEMMATEKDQLTSEQRARQLEILIDMMKYLNVGNDLTSVVTAQSFDTKPPKSRASAMVIMKNYELVKQKGTFLNVEKIIDGSYLESMQNVVNESMFAFDDLFLLETERTHIEARQMLLNQMTDSDIKGAKPGTDAKVRALNKMSASYLTAILQRIPDSTGDKVADHAPRLLFGETQVKKIPYSKILELGDNPFTEKGVNTMRVKGNNHFGNPWTATESVKKKNPSLILVKDIPTAVRMYREWIDGKHPDVNPKQRKWILENLSKLKGQTLLYMQPREGQVPYYSHADELAKIVNERFPSTTLVTLGQVNLKKVISGMQTGVDMAGLEAAFEIGIPTGGTAAAKFQQSTEGDKKTFRKDLAEKYGLKEGKLTRKTGKFGEYDDVYYQRTIDNAQEADGTIWFGNASSPGGRLTLGPIAQKGKPSPLVNPKSKEEIIRWMSKNNIQVLNVAGNREHTNPGIFDTSKNMLKAAFQQIKSPSEAPAVQTGQSLVQTGDIFTMKGIPVITTNLGGVHGAGLAKSAAEKGLVKKGDGEFKASEKVVQLPVKKVWSDNMAMNNNMELLKSSLRSLITVAKNNPSKTYLLPLAGLGHGEGSVAEIMPLLIKTVKASENIKLVLPKEGMSLGRPGTVRKDTSLSKLPEITEMLKNEGLLKESTTTIATEQFSDQTGLSMAQKVARIKEGRLYPELKDNLWINKLLPKIQPLRNREDNDSLELMIKGIDPIELAALEESFREIISLQPDLAKDLMYTAILQSGTVSSPYQLLAMIPGDYYQNWVKERLEFVMTGESRAFDSVISIGDAERFLTSFFANNLGDRAIVPKVFKPTEENPIRSRFTNKHQLVAVVISSEGEKFGVKRFSKDLYMYRLDNSIIKVDLTRAQSRSFLNFTLNERGGVSVADATDATGRNVTENITCTKQR